MSAFIDTHVLVYAPGTVRIDRDGVPPTNQSQRAALARLASSSSSTARALMTPL